jgi:hypothetical protein
MYAIEALDKQPRCPKYFRISKGPIDSLVIKSQKTSEDKKLLSFMEISLSGVNKKPKVFSYPW